CSCSLATPDPAEMANRRSTGSSRSVANDTSMAEIWLPSASPSPSGRVLTGTIATNELSGDSARASSRRRRPPATPARITSLTVQPKTPRTNLASSSGTQREEKRLRLETAPLSDVREAEKKAGG